MNKEQIIKIVNNHKQELHEKYGVEKIGLFGSYAKDSAQKESDIDIVVELKKPDLFLLIALKDHIEKILKSDVDIVRYRDNMNTLLKQRINKEAIYV